MAKAKSESGNCVLTLPLITEPWQEHIMEIRFAIMEHLKNALIGFELKKLRNLTRTKAYKNLQKQIEEADEKGRKPLYKIRTQMLRDAGFSEFDFINDITPMQKHYVEHIGAHVAHQAASDVSRAFDKYLYSNGHMVHFHRRGTLESVANKKFGNCMSYRDGIFIWNGGKETTADKNLRLSKNPNSQTPLPIKLSVPVTPPRNEYEREMLRKPIKYLRVVRKWMKTRYKYYLQFTLEGDPVKKDRAVGHGRVGIDIGTQTIAVCSETHAFLEVLAERVQTNHTRMIQLQRRMDASRRATNPDNYNPNGTIKRGVRLRWHYSKAYRRLAGQVRELQRKNADIRKYSHYVLAARILALGDEVFVEHMQFRGLAARAKETTRNEKGAFNKKKRFGKSIANRAPKTFLTLLDQKLQQYAGTELHEVDTKQYRASQFDHTDRQYHKKTLSTRMFPLAGGDTVQRDLYSAFLLMNPNDTLTAPDGDACDRFFPTFLRLHGQAIDTIKANRSMTVSSFGLA